MAEIRMRIGRFCRGANYGIHRTRPRRAGNRADAANHHRRAILRRGWRDAVGHPRAFRRTHQQSLGIGSAQAFLPQLQLRAAGRGHRQWLEHRSGGAAQFPAGRCFSFPECRNCAADSGAGGAGLAHLRNSLALGRQSRAGLAALSRRQESPAADSAHALR